MGGPKMVIPDICYGPLIVWPLLTTTHEEISEFDTGEYVENQKKTNYLFIQPFVINHKKRIK